jgi:hypothetical protein
MRPTDADGGGFDRGFQTAGSAVVRLSRVVDAVAFTGRAGPILNGRPPELHSCGTVFSAVRWCSSAPVCSPIRAENHRRRPSRFAVVRTRNCPRAVQHACGVKQSGEHTVGHPQLPADLGTEAPASTSRRAYATCSSVNARLSLGVARRRRKSIRFLNARCAASAVSPGVAVWRDA